MKKGMVISSIAIIVIVAIIVVFNNSKSVNYIDDNNFLYDIAIDYLREEYMAEDKEYNQKDNYHIFFDYEGFGITKEDNIKYAYMWILEESYYVEDDEIKLSSSSSMPYKIKFIDNVVVDFETSKDGTEYVSSIKGMFPDDIEDKVIKFSLSDAKIKKEVDDYYSDIVNQLN